MKKQDIIILSAILIGLTLVRVLFDIPNFNPIGAVALMGGILFGKKLLAYAVPLGAILIGDIILGTKSAMNAEYLFSSSFFMVYLSYAVIITIGIALAKKPNLINVLGGSLVAAAGFFLISNAGAWISLDVYPKSLGGLVAAYKAGIPFFRSTLVSQVIFSLGIYGVYSAVTQKKLALT
jgi:hypothetical protein